MISLLLVASLSISAEPPTPTTLPVPNVAEVTAKLDDLYRADSSHARLSMHIKTEHYERSLTVEAWSRGDNHALFVIRSPAREAGTATLRNPEGIWSYLPRADRLVRIPSGMLSESWMGSHFTNDDLVRENSYQSDYETVAAWLLEGRTRYLELTMTPRDDAAVIYTRMRFLLAAESWLPIRAEYYDGSELIRTTHFRDVKTLSGRRLPTVLEVIPADSPEESTRITYEALTLDQPIESNLFTPRGLRRSAHRR